MSYRMRNIVIAVGLALFAALLTTFYVKSYKKRVQSAQAGRTVLVAAGDIKVGTSTVDLIAKKLIVPKEVASKQVVAGAIDNPARLTGLLVTQPIYAGEQITARRFGTTRQIGIRAQLRGTDRAVQLAGDPNQTLAGTIHAGDHVDFVGVVKATGVGNDFTFARVFVRNLKVLRVDQGGNSKLSNPNGGNSVMLALSDAQSQKLAMIYKEGTYWTLALRPGIGDTDSPNSVETALTLFKDGIDYQKLVYSLTIQGYDPQSGTFTNGANGGTK